MCIYIYIYIHICVGHSILGKIVMRNETRRCVR